ncbi:MAG: multicopper oxidase family protein [Treponema sp.]|nr:multicopper oxidase family protein [Treponema sp.]
MKKAIILLAAALLPLGFAACMRMPFSRGQGAPFQLPAGEIGDPSYNPYNILTIQPKTHYDIVIEPTSAAIIPGLTTRMNHYSTGLPGGAVIVERNASLSFNVFNNIDEATTVHWHGLKVTNDQDGPFSPMAPGESAAFAFSLDQAGTHWYHPHTRPLLPQMNSGLYAPFIVKEAYDALYAGDYVLALDDWALSPTGAIDDRYGTGGMEVFGNVETVNKRTGSDIYPIELKRGEIVKLRFINASTAQWHTLSLPGHDFRVTHLDGHPILEPYVRSSVTIFPGQRVDVELKGIYDGGVYFIANERDMGMKIPVVYTGAGAEMTSPFVAPESKAFPGIESRPVDFHYALSMQMGMRGMGMEWAINGEVFPNVTHTHLRVGEVYKLRFINMDMMMMAIPHPMHIHGEHFLVVSVNGAPPPTEIWLDTIEVNPGEYVDIAIRFDNPGMWMMHCHIIDHEDAGMMTMIMAEL